ncbi:MAG: hypothetical protein ABI199_09495 [Bacteroidia bacterium]
MPSKKASISNPSKKKDKVKKDPPMPEEYEEQRTTAVRMHPQPLKHRIKKINNLQKTKSRKS